MTSARVRVITLRTLHFTSIAYRGRCVHQHQKWWGGKSSTGTARSKGEWGFNSAWFVRWDHTTIGLLPRLPMDCPVALSASDPTDLFFSRCPPSRSSDMHRSMGDAHRYMHRRINTTFHYSIQGYMCPGRTTCAPGGPFCPRRCPSSSRHRPLPHRPSSRPPPPRRSPPAP